MQGRAWIAVLWPAFVLAGIVEAVFFTLFDPHDLRLFGAPLDEVSRVGTYTIGFFVFWLLLALAGALSLWAYTRWDSPAQHAVGERQ